MIYAIDLDEIIEIRAKLGHPDFTHGRDEYRCVLSQEIERPWDVNPPVGFGRVEAIFKFNFGKQKWDFSLKI